MASSENISTASLDDLLKLQAAAFAEHKEQVKELLTLLEEERKETKAARELMEDQIKEYDRLTQRTSVQIQALIQLTEDLQNIQTQ